MKTGVCVIVLYGAAVLSASGVTEPQIVASTYLGGDGRDSAVDVAIDAEGNAYVLGDTAFGALDTGGLPLEHLPQRPPSLPPGFPFTGPDVFVVKYAPDLKSVKYSALAGGSFTDKAVAIVADAQGNTVILVSTESPDFPTRNPVQPDLQETSGLAVMKLSADGQQVIFSTYLGGESLPVGFSGRADLALDAAGQIYITGTTFSDKFPVTKDAFQPRPGAGMPNGFITKLSADGGLIYSTYLGGSGNDECRAIAVTADGNAFVGGRTTSTDFPLVKPLNASLGAGDGPNPPGTLFVAKLNAAGTALDFCSFLVGDGAVNALALTPQRTLVVAGRSSGGLTTTPNAPLRSASGGFMLELNPDLNAVAYCTHLGSAAEAVRLGASPKGELAVSGTTSGSLPGAQRGSDAFAAKFDPSRNVIYSAQIGGSNTDEGHDLAFVPNGDLLLVGMTQSDDFPLAGALRANPISDEGFVTQVTDGLVRTNGTTANPGTVPLVMQSYTDRGSANLPRRFYRVRNVPP